MENTQSTGKLPEKNFRAGAINVSVWNNEGTSKTGEAYAFKSISLERGYKDKDGNWKNTSSFKSADIPRLALALQKAYEFMVMSKGTNEEVVA
tara:strand:- start:2802 stop:3080 length:279 start_codon:yes stop_codon:yes gene_type:complete